MKYLSLLSVFLFLACAVKPQRFQLNGSNVEKNTTTEEKNGDSTSQSKPSDTGPVLGQDQTAAPAAEDKDASLYAFDGAFPIAASLMGTNWTWNRKEDMPIGWGETSVFTALLDYTYLSGSTEYKYIISKVYDANVNKGEKNFINEFYDDTGWWGLAWIRAYDITKEQRYLDAAKVIADYMYSTGWKDTTCGGGLIWQRGRDFKSAIGNGLFIKLTASLHSRISGDTHYLDLSKKGWDWFLKSGLVNEGNIVMDGVDGDCKAGGTPFSYNQGLILGAAAELYKGTKDAKYTDYAKKIVKDGMKYFSNKDGILFEANRNNDYDCSQGDNIFFRGAYVRNLRELNEVLKDDEIKAFIFKTAQFAWNKSRGDYDAVASCWEKGAFDNSYDPGRQTSALDLMNGTIVKKVNNVVLRKTVTSSAESCQSNEGPNNVIDGDSSTKWCAKNPSDGAAINLDMGSSRMIHRVRIAHAGSAAMLGDDKKLNTQDFEILVSGSANGPWQEAAKVTGNKSSGTSSLINKTARFLRVHVSNPGSDGIVRLYEIIVE